MRVTGRLDLASPPEGSRLDAETQLFRLCVLTEPFRRTTVIPENDVTRQGA